MQANHPITKLKLYCKMHFTKNENEKKQKKTNNIQKEMNDTGKCS